MKKGFWVAAGLIMAGGPIAATAQDVAYDSAETEQIVEALLEAHGGKDAWMARGEAASFTHTMFTPYVLVEGDTQWWISHEIVEHDPAGRVYHEWPIDGATMAFDGETTWWVDWARPNPAPALRRTHYNFVFLPFLTQREGVAMARLEDARLPEDDVDSIVLSLTFAGRDRPSFLLFVDPDEAGLRGWQMGGALHTVHRWGEADGIRYPMDWSTRVEGNVIGHHSIIDVTLDTTLDPALLVAPPGAQTDAAAGG